MSAPAIPAAQLEGLWNQHLDGEFQIWPRQGRRVQIVIVVVVEFEGAKLAHERIYWDHAGVLRQLGLLGASIASV